MTTRPSTLPATVVCNACGSRRNMSDWPVHLADCDGAALSGATRLYEGTPTTMSDTTTQTTGRAAQMERLLVELRAQVYALGLQASAVLERRDDGSPMITITLSNRRGEVTTLEVGPHTPRHADDREPGLLYLCTLDHNGYFERSGIVAEFDGWEALGDLDLSAYLAQLAYDRWMGRMESAAAAYAHGGY